MCARNESRCANCAPSRVGRCRNQDVLCHGSQPVSRKACETRTERRSSLPTFPTRKTSSTLAKSAIKPSTRTGNINKGGANARPTAPVRARAIASALSPAPAHAPAAVARALETSAGVQHRAQVPDDSANAVDRANRLDAGGIQLCAQLDAVGGTDGLTARGESGMPITTSLPVNQVTPSARPSIPVSDVPSAAEIGSDIDPSTRTSIAQTPACTGSGDSADSSPSDLQYLNEKFDVAFGAPLLNHDGGPDDDDRRLWWQMVGLRGKQYALPGRRVGVRFVNILAAEIESCTAARQSSEREFLFTSLVLQRDKMVKKARDIRPMIARRLDMWESGQHRELLQEALRCDRQMKEAQTKMTSEHVERVFNRLMLLGRVRAAMRFLLDRGNGGVLDSESEAYSKQGALGKTVFEVLQDKHPEQRAPDRSAFLSCDELPPLEQVDVTSSHIEHVARSLRGSAGPSGTDADQWKSFLLRFGKASDRLREAVAASTRLHANEVVPWDDIRALLARRGIALDKQPGVRPIGIGEVRQRIEAKAMALATRLDVVEICGADQLCSGAKAGIEAAVHAMRDIFESEDTEGVLLVDASNAFNTISRPAMLWNCRVLWPRCSRFLFNVYRGFSVIVFRGVTPNAVRILFSREGTTQGCPLAMLAYAIGILPLIRLLKDPSQHIQSWYADDSACSGFLRCIRNWFDRLLAEGPSYGYFAEPSKSTLVVKEENMEEARILFADLQVNIVLASRFLGGCVGDKDGVQQFVRSRVEGWVEAVSRLADAAKTYPQSAHSAFTHSLSNEWTYVQRVIEGYYEEYEVLKDTIQKKFTPSLLGREVLQCEHDLFSLPARKGGLAISDPTSTGIPSFLASRSATAVLQASISSGKAVCIIDHDYHCRSALKAARVQRETREKDLLAFVLTTMPSAQRRTLTRIIDGEASGWLTVMPLASEGFDLSATQFRDQLALRYHHTPASFPAKCDGCGDSFTIQHALDCKKGGLVKKGHNDVRDNDVHLAEAAWGGVTVEPVLVPEDDRTGHMALQADWCVRGVWEGSRVAFFDNRIIDADAPSYLSSNLSWEATAKRAVNEKKKKYAPVVEELRGSITPLVCSTDCVLQTEYAAYQRRLASRLAAKWERPLSTIMAWVRVKTQFSIIRAVDLRLRGRRQRMSGLCAAEGLGPVV